MLKNVTQSIIDNCNKKVVELREYIVIDGQEVPVKAELSDSCYDEGNYIGTFIFKEIRFEAENIYNFKENTFQYFKVIDGESVNFGTFITTEYNNNDSKNIVKVVGMDLGLKAQVEYKSNLDYASGNVTLLDVWNECCELSGLESGIEHFTNDDFIVDSDQFTGEGGMSGVGTTIRDVFKAIAQISGNFVKVMDDDKIYLMFTNDTNEIIEEYTELEDKRDTWPITCLSLGLEGVEGESVILRDETLIEQYGEHWLVINNNPFGYTYEKREQLATAIFNKVKGFGYSSFVSDTSFKPYLTCGDLIRYRTKDGTLVQSAIWRYSHKFEDITLEAPSLTNATIVYQRPIDIPEAVKDTGIRVDKAEQNITQLTRQTNQNSEQLVQVTQNISSIQNLFQITGGSNLIKNSQGLLDDDVWNEQEGGTYVMGYDADLAGKTIAVSKLGVSNGKLSTKDINITNLLVGNRYTLNYFITNEEDATTTIRLIGHNVIYEKTFNEECEMQDEVFEFIADTSNYILEIESTSLFDTFGYIYDLMLNSGDKKPWEPSIGEIVGTVIKLSQLGLQIYCTGSNIATLLTSQGFQVHRYQNGQLYEVITEFTDKGIVTSQIIYKEDNMDGLIHKVIQSDGYKKYITYIGGDN